MNKAGGGDGIPVELFQFLQDDTVKVLHSRCQKIRDTKGAFHAKMGSIKDRNGMVLTEAEDIKRGGKNIQKNCTKKIFITQIIVMV